MNLFLKKNRKINLKINGKSKNLSPISNKKPIEIDIIEAPI
jgi:hypothetical protein